MLTGNMCWVHPHVLSSPSCAEFTLMCWVFMYWVHPHVLSSPSCAEFSCTEFTLMYWVQLHVLSSHVPNAPSYAERTLMCWMHTHLLSAPSCAERTLAWLYHRWAELWTDREQPRGRSVSFSCTRSPINQCKLATILLHIKCKKINKIKIRNKNDCYHSKTRSKHMKGW